jgi:2,4-dienoyl-CoA reductase-like NADH-dependent reductase (Old Yellow Enzyme family)
MSTPSVLFSPFRLAGLELSNRIVVAPMCQYSADDGCANDWHLMHLGTLAQSGAALLMVEATAVERHGRITHGCLGLYSDANEADLARVVAHCRRYGSARLGIQIGHAGRKASSQVPWDGGRALQGDEDAWPTMAPSAIPFAETWPEPRAMSRADMDRVRDAFVATARRALRLDFDLVELHGAHGYLLHSFMSPISNRRDDEHGGSMDNRMRFPLEVIAAVRDVWPKDRPLGMRITGSDWLDGGITPDDAVAIARSLKTAGIDYVCVSSGGVDPSARVKLEPGYQVPFAARVREEAGVATRAVGLISTPGQAEAVVAEGKADQVALARAMLDNPHWGWMAARALGAEVARPVQYLRAADSVWPGAKYVD